jgi:hypothetical protein
MLLLEISRDMPLLADLKCGYLRDKTLQMYAAHSLE